MNIMDDHLDGMEDLADLFMSNNTILEIRFTKGNVGYIHRVRILKSKLSEEDFSLLKDINTKDVFMASILIKDLKKSKDRKTELQNCITSNFRDATFYLFNKKYSVHGDEDLNGNMKNSVNLILKRVE